MMRNGFPRLPGKPHFADRSPMADIRGGFDLHQIRSRSMRLTLNSFKALAVG
jgi:hypothetical protein